MLNGQRGPYTLAAPRSREGRAGASGLPALAYRLR